MSNRTRKILYFTALLFWIAFIFSNSLRPGDASNEQSNFVTSSLNDLLALFSGSLSLTGGFVRMLAHVGEFFVLGALLSISEPILERHSQLYLWCISLAGIAIAVVDETIQYFVPGRSMSLLDIWLDAIGAVLGVWFLFFLRHIRKQRQKNQ